MKKTLFFLFFLLFTAIIFIWDSELTDFWMDQENRNFLIREFVTWGSQYAFILDFLHAYRYPITIIGLSYFGYTYFRKKQKKKRERMKRNPFTGEKVIYDANAILSPESLPESEEKREKSRKEGPPLIIKKPKKEKALPETIVDDIDPETMKKMLGSK